MLTVSRSGKRCVCFTAADIIVRGAGKRGKMGCGGIPHFTTQLTFVHTVGSKGDSKRAKIAPTTMTNKEPALAGLKTDFAMLRRSMCVSMFGAGWGGGVTFFGNKI